MSLHRALLVTLGITMLIGLTMSADPLEESSKGVQFNYEDSVTGHGNFASSNKITAQGPHADAHAHSRLADVVLKKSNHGSGSIEIESIIISNESIINQTDPEVIYAFGLIAALENSSMAYDPQTMSIGNGYYATHNLQLCD